MLANKTQYLLQKKFPNDNYNAIDTKLELNQYCTTGTLMEDYKKYGLVTTLEDGIMVNIEFEF